MSSTSSVEITTGLIHFNVQAAGKPCATSYKLFGDLRSGMRPLIALHGGPGASAEYLEVLSDITRTHGIPLIVYDQIGNGLSTHLPEKSKDSSFWTMQLFLDELANVLDFFGLKDNYDLLGHSWGGILASSHAISQPHGLKHLVLASAPPDMPLAVKEMQRLKTLLPQSIQDIIDAHERAGTTDSEEYRQACGEFYQRYLCRLDPMPAPIASAFEWIQKDSTVYFTLYGTAEFEINGTLKDWTIVKDAHRISSPTLLTNGAYDQVTDAVMEPFFKEIPVVQWVKFASSSHVPHFEERAKFMEALVHFLSS